VARIEHLLAIEGMDAPKSEAGTAKVPPALLEEVFELNEELDAIREAREAGEDAEALRGRLEAARAPIARKREQHEQQLNELSARWDAQLDAGAGADEKRRTLTALRERLLERNYINNLLASIEREMSGLGLSDLGSGAQSREPRA
jgi:molecular chaperone HscB